MLQFVVMIMQKDKMHVCCYWRHLKSGFIESNLPDNLTLLMFLDEGQHLAQVLSNKFVSRFGNPPRPLYNVFIHAVTVFSKLKLTIMGTHLSIAQIDQLGGSHDAKSSDSGKHHLVENWFKCV